MSDGGNQSDREAAAAGGKPDDNNLVDGGGSGSSELSDPHHPHSHPDWHGSNDQQPGWYKNRGGGGGSVELSDPGRCGSNGVGSGSAELSDPRHDLQPGCYGSGGGGRGSVEPSDPAHGQPRWYYGINGGDGSGGAGLSDYVQHHHVGYPYWYAGGGGESSGGGSMFNLHDGYAGYGADDTREIAEDWRAAAGVNRNRSYGGGANEGGWYRGNGGASDGGDWYWRNSVGARDEAPGYRTDFFVENGGRRSGEFSPLPRADVSMHPVTGNYWTGSGSSSAVDRHSAFMPGNNGSSSFPLPRNPNSISMYEHQHARADHYWNTGVRGDHHHPLDVMHGNGDACRPIFASPPGNGFRMHAPPHCYEAPNGRRSHSRLQRYKAHINDIIAWSLRLTIGSKSNHDDDSVVPRGLPEFQNQGQAAVLNTGNNCRVPFNEDPYAGMRLEDVRGRMIRVARDLPGCQFLARMVDEGGPAAARLVLDDLAGDVVRFMSHSAGHVLVDKLAEFWTDEEMITRVLGILRAAPTGSILAAAKYHAGSNILQTLIVRIADKKHLEQAETFARILAGVGENGVLCLIEDMSGSNLIIKFLEKFSAKHNQFIIDVALKFSNRICRDRHGCHVFKPCIDKAGDQKTRDLLIHAVCRDALLLAEHGAGNYVVQHVIEAVKEVPWAADALHQAFRGRYVSLARQKASSHVVQRCLEKFPTQQRDEIVYELIHCERHCSFGDLISDPYANYVLQTAMVLREGQMQRALIDTICSYRDILGGDRFAKQVFQKLSIPGRPLYR